MNKEKLICEMCGRLVNDEEYITSTEGDVICKCCAFDAFEDSYYVLMNVVRHLRNALEAASPSMVAMKNALEMLPEEVLEQMREYNDADNTETNA